MKKLIQKLVQMKGKMDSACAVCTEITTNIAKGGSWEPLSHPSLLGKLRTARNAIEAVKVKNKFWKTWAMGGTGLATQLKTFDEKTLRKQQGGGGRARREAEHARGEEREDEEDALG